MTWKVIFWKIWAYLQSFRCGKCEQDYVASELGHCSYHPNPPAFLYGSNKGA